MMDIHAKHQRVMRHFIERVHPTVQLSEYDPMTLGMPDSKFQWSDYDLLLIDNELGEVDGIEWLKSMAQKKDCHKIYSYGGS
jgi:DNA-binding response OmpR family regulator